MRNAYADIENKQTPLITIRFTGHAATDESFQQYLDDLESLYDAQQPISLIFNAEKAVLPKFKHQQKQAQWLKDKEALMRAYCRGTAYVIQSTVIRWVLKAIFALQAQPVPYAIVDTQQAAETWAQNQLKQKQ
ncbi:MAG: STAS/SEC14 domain-containing protein [Saprospiraceae bacterium]|nr:STAS/SEC14 domain-containing protein [Saprospiraceae bacterium]